MSQIDATLKSLQSRWRAVYSEVEGEMTPINDFSALVLEHTGNAFTVTSKGVVVDEGTFSVDVTATPHELVYIYSKGAPRFLGAPRRGIFQVEGNTLKLCMSPIGHAAPAQFNTRPNSQVVFNVWQRTDAKGTDTPSAVSALVANRRVESEW
jgi:uncharacterized protein (TIGR03067 family)